MGSKEEIELFKVTDKDLRIEYPELAQVDEFGGTLKTKELKFVWYFANRTSPLLTATNGERNRIAACIKYAYGYDTEEQFSEEHIRWTSKNFPEKIRLAIQRMERFNPSARLRAKLAIEKVFDNLESSLILDDTTQEAIKGDIDLKKKYVELSVKVAESMPNVVMQMEQGFGVSATKSYTKDDKGPTLMDELHMEDSED